MNLRTLLFVAVVGAVVIVGTVSAASRIRPREDAGHEVPKSMSGRVISQRERAAAKRSKKGETPISDIPFVLGYLTPWNGDGYDNALLYAGRPLTAVSPCWLHAEAASASSSGKVKLMGTHHFDEKKEWLDELKKQQDDDPSRTIEVLPRIVFEQWGLQEYTSFLGSIEQIRSFITELHSHIDDIDIVNGVVIDFAGLNVGAIRKGVQRFLHELKNYGGGVGRVVYVATANRPQMIALSDEDVKALESYVDGISLNTYDYSGFQTPGPVAPYPFRQFAMGTVLGTIDAQSGAVKKNGHISPAKVLMGVNFYGMRYVEGHPEQNGHVINRDFMGLLKGAKKPTLQWDSTSREHKLEFRSKKSGAWTTVYYPTTESIREAVRLARAAGTGVSIWEIGQGLHQFWDAWKEE